MWISEKLREQPEKSGLRTCRVVSSGAEASSAEMTSAGEAPAGEPAVSGLGPVRALHPYGIYFRLPEGEAVGCLGNTVLGSFSPPPMELREGDLCLCAGSASLLLTREGKVFVNGKEIG